MVRTTWIIFSRRIKGSQPKQNKFRKFAACQNGGEIAVLFEVALRSNLKRIIMAQNAGKMMVWQTHINRFTVVFFRYIVLCCCYTVESKRYPILFYRIIE